MSPENMQAYMLVYLREEMMKELLKPAQLKNTDLKADFDYELTKMERIAHDIYLH